MLKRIVSALRPPVIFLGLDMNEQSVKLCQVERRGAKPPRVTRFSSEPLPPGAVDEGKIIQIEIVANAVKKALIRLNAKTKKVHLLVPSQQALVRFLNLPDLPKNKLRKAVDFELRQYVRLPFEDPLYDFVRIETDTSRSSNPKKGDSKVPGTYDDEPMRMPDRDTWLEAAAGLEVQPVSGHEPVPSAESVGKSAELCEVLLVAASRAGVEPYVNAAKMAGLKPVSVEIKALSLLRSIEHSSMAAADDTLLSVDISNTLTEISIYSGGILRMTRSVPVFFDGEHSDQDFSYGCSELAHELDRMISFYTYTLNHRNAQFETIVVTGDADRLDGIVDSLSRQMQQQVVKLMPGDVELGQSISAKLYPAMAGAVGAALRGNSK
jgi:Tfp pilus assembly PilM family ATPase